MKKSVFLCLVAGVLAFTACSEKNVDSGAELQDEAVLELVAQPDFVFSSLGNTLFSTFPATRATSQVAQDLPDLTNGVEVNLSACTSKEYNASKVSIHIREANDVTVFIPAKDEWFSGNDANSLAIIKKNATGNGVYGENEQTLQVAGQEVKATVEFATTGITVKVTGVNDAVVASLKEEYGDGLTVEVWNYFKDATLDNLKTAFNDVDNGATVSFSTQPSVYVNAFAKIPEYWELATDDYFPTVTSKDESGFQVPYLGENKLNQKYWVRPAVEVDGENIVLSKDYLIYGHKNAYDCTVKPLGATFTRQEANNADIPADVDKKVYDLPGNYNVFYF